MPTEPALSKAEFDRLNRVPVPPVFLITIEQFGNWADTEYRWHVTAWDSKEILWEGFTETGWGARRQSKRAVKKLRKGKRQPEPVTYPQEIYVYP